MDHGRVPSVSREPVHRYHWKTPVSLLFIFTNTSLEGTILAWRIRHVCRVLPFPRVASGGSRNIHASDANDRVELNPLPRIGRKWFQGEVVGFFESRKLVAPPAMIRHTHTHIRIFVFLSGGLVHRWPRMLSRDTLSLMVNGSARNPLKTSRRKTRNRIDRGENWRRIDCYPRGGFEPVQFHRRLHRIVLCLVAASSQFELSRRLKKLERRRKY